MKGYLIIITKLYLYFGFGYVLYILKDYKVWKLNRKTRVRNNCCVRNGVKWGAEIKKDIPCTVYIYKSNEAFIGLEIKFLFQGQLLQHDTII